MTNAIETGAFLPHPPAKVWRSLTVPDLPASWLMPNDFRAEVGHRFTFRTDPVPAQGFDGIVHCEVLALEPPDFSESAGSSVGSTAPSPGGSSPKAPARACSSPTTASTRTTPASRRPAASSAAAGGVTWSADSRRPSLR